LSVKGVKYLIDFGCRIGTFTIQAVLREGNVFAVDISQNMFAYDKKTWKKYTINFICKQRLFKLYPFIRVS
jgi:cyclopropane fatty-acyl-phospholipid synthase-like methyltransferase